MNFVFSDADWGVFMPNPNQDSGVSVGAEKKTAIAFSNDSSFFATPQK